MEHQRLTNKEVKKKNRNQIFRYICTHGTVSNPDIVSDLHLSLPTVTNTTRELLESGLLRDLGEMQSTGGRRARALCAASDYRFSIGLDITRNHLGILLLNLTGDIIKYERMQLGFPEVPPISPKFVRKLMIFSWKRRFPENRSSVLASLFQESSIRYRK